MAGRWSRARKDGSMARRLFSRTPHGVTTRPGASLWPPRAGGRRGASRSGRSGGERRLRAHQVAAAVDAAVASCQAGVGRPAAHLVDVLAAGVAVPPGAPVGPAVGVRGGGGGGGDAGTTADDPTAREDTSPSRNAGTRAGDERHRLVDRALARALVEAVASAWVIGW